MTEYRRDLLWAQRYARANREAMLNSTKMCRRSGRRPLRGRGARHHNYVARRCTSGQEVLVTGKGAIRAGKGELASSPGRWAPARHVVRGPGEPDSFRERLPRRRAADEPQRGKAAVQRQGPARRTQGVECRKDGGILDELPAASKGHRPGHGAAARPGGSVAERLQVLCVKG